MKNPLKTYIKYLKDDGKARTLVRTGKSSGGGMGAGGGDRTQRQLESYWNYYHEGTVFASINSTIFNIVMVGYTIESEDLNAKQYIETLCNKLDFENILIEAAQHALIFGDSFIEKRKTKGGEVSSLYVVDPRTMFIDYDNHGIVTGYYQVIQGKRVGGIIKPEDIIHIRFIPTPGTPYGLSIIEPNVITIDRKVDTDEAIYNAIKRHGMRKIVATVGSEKDGQIPPDDVMDNITEKLDDINEINDFVVPWMIKLEALDEKGVEGVSEYYDLFQTQLIVGIMGFEEALGLGKGSTEATARVKASLWERMIKSFQYSISKDIENQLFADELIRNGFKSKDDPEYPVSVHLKFNSVTDEDEALRAKWMGNLLRGFPDGEMPFTRNEIRAFFGLQPRSDMDEGSTDKKPKEKTKKPKKEPKKKEKKKNEPTKE